MMGAGSIGCLTYGLSVVAFVLSIGMMGPAILRSLQSEERAYFQQASGFRFHFAPFFMVFLAAAAAGSVGGFVDAQGLERGWFAGQTECPGLWPDPRSLRRLADEEIRA